MVPDASSNADGRPLAWALSFIGLALLANTLAMAIPPLAFPTASGCAMRTPILCAELPQSGADLAAVLRDSANDPDLWRHQVFLDFPFLLLYSALLAGGAVRAWPSGRLRWAAVTLVVVGAGLDVFENLGILGALSGLEGGAVPDDGAAGSIRMFALAKFTALCAACLVAAAGSLRQSEATGVRVVIALTMVPCAIGLLGWLEPMAIEVAGLGIAVSCLLHWVRAIAGRKRETVGAAS